MSSQSDFSHKFLIQFNNEFHIIYFKYQYYCVHFKTVLESINSQLNLNLSLNTHSFQTFDQTFGVCVSVISDNQWIENLSRIRIDIKDTNVLDNGLNTSVSEETAEVKSLMASDVSEPINQKLKNAMESTDLSEFRLKTDSISKNSLSKKKKWFIHEMSSEQILMFTTLVECITSISDPNDDLSIFWIKVTKLMKTKGYKGCEWRQVFADYVNNRYGQVLIHATNHKNGQKMYPLFELIESMDLEKLMSQSSYQRLSKLRAKVMK